MFWEKTRETTSKPWHSLSLGKHWKPLISGNNGCKSTLSLQLPALSIVLKIYKTYSFHGISLKYYANAIVCAVLTTKHFHPATSHFLSYRLIEVKYCSRKSLACRRTSFVDLGVSCLPCWLMTLPKHTWGEHGPFWNKKQICIICKGFLIFNLKKNRLILTHKGDWKNRCCKHIMESVNANLK